MIKGILFALGFILLAVAIGLCIYFGIKCSKDRANNSIIKRTDELTEKYKNELRDFSYAHTRKEIDEEAKRLQNLLDAEIAALKPAKSKNSTRLLVSIIAAVACLCFVVCVPGSFHQVEAGTYAVVKDIGKISDVRTPGTYFDFYMTKGYQTYDATVQQVKINTQAYSKDGQTMDLEVYLQYQIQLDKLVIRDENGVIIQTDGIAGKYVTLESLQARIETQCIEKTKSVMSSAEAMEIIKNRSTYSTLVSQTVRDAIGPDYYVNVQDVVLTDISFTDEFEKSVEDKVVAEQEKQAAITKAQAELEVAKIEAQKKIAEAEGSAEARLIEANAAAKAATAKIVELSRTVGYTVSETTTAEGITTYVIDTTSGPGEAEFKTIVEGYLEYLAYLEKWNGELPQVVAGEDTLSIIVPNN